MTSGTGSSPSHRFPRSARLRKRAEFDRVYQQGSRHFGGHLTVFFLRREAQPPRSTTPAGGPRVGFTVGRALGNAVVRNRIRRRVREAVRRNLGRLSGPVDVVVHPRKSALKAPFSELDAEAARALDAVATGRAAGKPKGKS
ncbi:MAG: ribonuclease P protein component [Terriglobales bacterium]